MKELGAFASIGRGKGTKGFGWVMRNILIKVVRPLAILRPICLLRVAYRSPLLLYRYHGHGILLTIDWKVDTIQKESCTVGK